MADDVNLTKGIVFLVSWSALAGVWWLIAILLIFIGPRRKRSLAVSASLSLSVFKPIPPIRNDAERKELADAMESFVAQLDKDDELVVGLDLSDLPAWQAILDDWQIRRPGVRIVVVAQQEPTHLSNPKIAWMEVLSAKAGGELWLWSDADVIAPPGFLSEFKNALAESKANAVTAAYAVRKVNKAAGMFDALFVNVEFLPGAVLLGRLGATEFSYGAATMFRKSAFHEHVEWADLGMQLADDHELGRRLKPVELAGTIVSTFTLPGSWKDALQHYYRWQKTVRWCRPGGFAAMITIIPLIGWSGAAIFSGGSRAALAGFTGQWLLEILVGIIVCFRLGCRLPPHTWAGLALWPLVRMISWLGTWLPLRVIWGRSEKAWSAPTKPPAKRAE